jgi:putative nucleotidyltransferase with HDIG domain
MEGSTDKMTAGNRDQMLDLLGKYIKNPQMIRHSLASEAVMATLADHLGENRQQWALAGLLHDIDVELTGADPRRHGLEAEKILAEHGITDSELIEAIKMHNEEATGIARSKKFHHALAAGETITGMIMATAMVYPDKKLASVKPQSIVKRMKEKAFAASVKRENILECEKLGVPLSEFAAMSLTAMQAISDQLGL